MYFNSLGCFLGSYYLNQKWSQWWTHDLEKNSAFFYKSWDSHSQSPMGCFRTPLSTHGTYEQFAHSLGQRSPLIFWADSYLGLPTPHGSSPVRSALWNLSLRNRVSIVWPPFHYASTPKCLSTQSSDFRGGDPHPCFLTSSPYHSPYLKGGKLQEKTCCTCQNTGLALMDMHETHCSKTLSAVH